MLSILCTGDVFRISSTVMLWFHASWHVMHLSMHVCVCASLIACSIYHKSKQNKCRGFEFMHVKELIKTNHLHLQSRISCQWFTQN